MDFLQLNKAFDNRIRLGIMSILVVNDEVDFSRMKELLQLTDGNLASHIAALEKEEYIDVIKKFVGKKPNTSYKASAKGKEAFKRHIEMLEQIIKNTK